MKKIAIVTGASRGIGREIAKMLAKEGLQVVANYNRSEQKAKELQKELKNENIDIDIFKADVSKREEAKALIKYTLNQYGRIDVLINNAGIAEFKEFTQITDAEWNKMINTNLNSVFIMSQEVLENMIHNKKGCIINISSIWGLVGSSCEVHYSTAKAGINGMTKALAKELGPSNIRVNAIAPGIINTEMNNDIEKEDIEMIEKNTPLGRIGKPEDIAKCVKWLVEDTFTTGQIISINGGWVIT